MNRPDVAPISRHVFVDPITNRLNLPRYNANSNRALVPAAESSTTNNFRMRTDYARSTVPRLFQSSSHLGKEVIQQEHRENMRDHPRLIRSTPYRLYDPRYAAIGLPVDPLLRAFKQNPNFSVRKEASDEISTINNIRTDCARNGVPMLHQSSSHSGKKVVAQEHGQSWKDHPQVSRPITNNLYDPRYAAIGLPVDPILRAFKQNPNVLKVKATSDESSTTNNIMREVVEREHTQSRSPRVIRRVPNRLYDPRYAAIGHNRWILFCVHSSRIPTFAFPSTTSDEKSEIIMELDGK